MVSSSIYLRLFIPFALTLILASVIGWWIGTDLVSRSLEKRLAEQLDHTAAVLSEGNFPFTADVLDRVGRLVRADIVLIDAEQRPSLSTLPKGNSPLMKVISDLYLKWQTSPPVDQWISFYHNKRPYMLVFRAIQPERDPRYTAVASVVDLSPVKQAARNAAWWLGAAAMVGIAILAWVGHRLARTITDPLRELASMAGEIANGKRAVRARVHHQDEIGDLANALNSMTSKLGEYEKGLAENSRLAAAEQMAARVAHEIRNPLTAIKMQIQLLAEGADTGDGTITHAILDEIRRLELIISNTLQSSKSPELVKHPANLNQLVSEVARLQQAHFTHRGIDLQTSLEAGLPDISLDADRIKQVLLNLLVNAADELPKGGLIRISTKEEATRGEVTLDVEDSGTGLPGNQLDTLFEPGESTKPGGFGLGLRVSRELVEQHGGTLSAQNSPLGGAMFTIKLPVEG